MAQFNNEGAVIGSILIDSKCISEIDKTGLIAEDFSIDVYREMFKVIAELREAGKEFADFALIADEMSKRRPGEDYFELMHDLLTYTTTAANAGLYCQVVKDNANRRRFVDLLVGAASVSNYGDWRAEADAVFEALHDLKTYDTDILTGDILSDQFLDYYEKTKKDPENAYIKTGFSDLDRQLGGGMFRSEVYIIGARPGMGKTTLGINIAQNIINSGGSVLFVSLEMSAPQIQAKRISLETNLRYTDLMAGRITPAQEFAVYDWITENKARPFYLTTKPATVGEIGRKARQIGNVSCIIIDYMGLISCQVDSRQKPKYEQMTEISGALKMTAKALNIPILALCQLNRESTTRSDKRPTMADLRDSGAIEQDAGAIILLHRPDYYTTRDSGEEPPELEEIELNIAKNRHAEPGLVRMWWHGNIGRISMQSRVKDNQEELPF